MHERFGSAAVIEVAFPEGPYGNDPFVGPLGQTVDQVESAWRVWVGERFDAYPDAATEVQTYVALMTKYGLRICTEF